MPAVDQCEYQVIRAFEKTGWIVITKSFAIRIDKNVASYVYADLRLRQSQNRQSIIVAEVKCFSRTRPLLDEFYHAVGQYAVYRNALTLNNIATPLYLAIPHDIYATFFQKPLIQAVLQDVRVKLVVVDLAKEEIVAWIP